MFDFDPSKAGAETKADFGVFLAGALGVKKLIDARLSDKKIASDAGSSKESTGGRSKK